MKMADKDKIILAVKCCLRNNDCSHCDGCPYNDVEDFRCRARLRNDIVALLEDWDAVKPKMVKFVDEGLTWQEYEVPTCGACGALLGDALFCPMCGRAVKWYD